MFKQMSFRISLLGQAVFDVTYGFPKSSARCIGKYQLLAARTSIVLFSPAVV